MNAIEELVLDLIAEDSANPDVFTDDDAGMAPIRDSVNCAIQELCALSGAYQRVFLLPLISGRGLYRLAPKRDHFGYVIEAFDRANHRKLTQTSIPSLAAQDPGWMRASFSPTHYFHVGDYLGVYGKPGASGIVLELRCVMIPRAYTADTDPVRVREQYQRAAAYYAVSEFYASRGDAKRATESWLEYLEVAELKRLTPTTGDRNFGMKQWQASTTV